MTNPTTRRVLRLPRTLTFTALHGAIAGAIACSGQVDAQRADAGADGASAHAVTIDGDAMGDVVTDAATTEAADATGVDAPPDGSHDAEPDGLMG
jgi:hypothetical protein